MSSSLPGIANRWRPRVDCSAATARHDVACPAAGRPKVHILHVHNRYRESGGEDAAVASERELLIRSGHQVTVLDAQNPSDAFSTAKALLRVPWNTAAADRVTHEIEQAQPDVVHVHNSWFSLGPAAVKAAARLRPTVLTSHNYRMSCVNGLFFRDGAPCTDCLGHAPWRGVAHRCYRDSIIASGAGALAIQSWRTASVWEAVSGFVAHNPLARDALVSAGAAEGRIHFVDNFTTDPGPRSTPPSASNQVLIVGRLSHEKGIHQAIEAWLRASPNLELKVVGSGPMEPQLRELAGDSVQFLGQLRKDEVVREMLQSRALLFPSIVFESQPMVLLEALAAGLPAIATDHPPSRWVLEDSQAGILVRPQSSQAIIEALPHVEDGDALDAMSISARSTWSRRFTPQHAIGALEDLYGVAIDAHRT